MLLETRDALACHTNIRFPSPIGGVPFSLDFAPSIIFAILYGMLIPLALYRWISKSSRTLTLFGTTTFAIERVVAMALRAKQSHNALDRTSRTLTRYMQVSWGTGYISLATALTTFLRALLVNATLPSSSSSSSPATHVESGSDGFIIMEEAPRAVTEEDRLNDRLWYRRVFDVTNWLYLVATVLGIVSGSIYDKAETDQGQANLIQGLRYASTGMAFGLTVAVQGIAISSILYTRNVIRSSALIVVGLTCLLDIICVYHLIIMRSHTTSLTSLESGSLNSTSDKALFYIFQIAPEWITAATVLGINARERFKTGLWGEEFLTKDKKPSS
ncbi:unnamed protein product [Somion occarium]|uniref:Uncharacterized protein n=1 Tax=Somion occarium TaxID=3059160 RepID=A0ABP1DGU9_9APHY